MDEKEAEVRGETVIMKWILRPRQLIYMPLRQMSTYPSSFSPHIFLFSTLFSPLCFWPHAPLSTPHLLAAFFFIQMPSRGIIKRGPFINIEKIRAKSFLPRTTRWNFKFYGISRCSNIFFLSFSHRQEINVKRFH